MNFLQRSNNFVSHRKEKKVSFVSIFSVCVLIIIFSFSAPRNFLVNTLAPLWSTENSFGAFIADSAALLKSKQSLIAENNTLKQQISDSQESIMLDSIMRKENDDLKNILNRKPTYQTQILAAVLVKPFLSAYDTLIIDVGATDDISVGDKVLANGNSYIGYISEVYANSSKVILYSSPGQKTQVLVGNDNVEKEALGLGGGNFSVDIPRETSIQEGDAIIVPSLSPNIFATVGKINSKEADSFQTVLFKNPVNIDELKWVEVIPSLNK